MLRPWIYLFIVLIGIFLKFYRIDYRYFWYDEVCTIMHTSGTSGNAFLEKLPSEAGPRAIGLDIPPSTNPGGISPEKLESGVFSVLSRDERIHSTPLQTTFQWLRSQPTFPVELA